MFILIIDFVYKYQLQRIKKIKSNKMAHCDGFSDDPLQVFRDTSEIDWKPVKNSKICDFYAGKHILITGATGFLGKLIVEKLLRACPNLAKIYILLREKKGQKIEERLKKIYNDPVYGPLTKLYPHFQEKIHVIPGDISAPNLNLSPDNRTVLTSKLNVIFHVAATVRFDEPLFEAIKTNVRATRDLINIAQRCPNLNSFVYVSTAFSNARQTEIDEIFYPFPVSVDDLIGMAEGESDDSMTTQMWKEWPNTYTFTKAAAEECVRNLGAGLPICVFRPAIVIATYQEPLKSWIDNMNGPTGTILGCLTGVLRTMHCDENIVAELVPADYVVNGIIAAGYNTAIDINKNKINIYNYVSAVENPMYWKELMKEIIKSSKKLGKHSSMQCFTHNMSLVTSSFGLYTIYTLLLHFMPAYLMDFGMVLNGRKPMVVQLYKKNWKLVMALGYFSTKQWKFSNNNTRALWKSLKIEDKQAFPFSMAEFNWRNFNNTHLLGLRLYLIKDNSFTFQMKTFYLVNTVLKALYYCGLLSLFLLFSKLLINTIL